MGIQRFDSILDTVEKLTIDEQETLLDILSHRITERRRAELVNDARDAREELRRGGCSVATPSELMKEILP